MNNTIIKCIAAITLGSATVSFSTAALAASPQRVSVANCQMPGSGYGSMFPSLNGARWSDTAINALSAAVLATAEENPTPESEVDTEDNLNISAGYTYFGQFVDHDLTTDNRPNDLTTPTPVSSLVNERTPQLDLDSMYGSGPTLSSTLYESDGMHLKIGSLLTGSSDTGARDLPRNLNGQANIGDPRNDENRIVASIHSMFIRLHNASVDRIRLTKPSLTSRQVFDAARRETVTAYQYVIIRDFLPQIVGQKQVDSVVRLTSKGWQTNLNFYNSCQQMPIEFAAAAYRFGHSMVRGLYRINATTERVPVFSDTYLPGSDLTGFSASPANFGVDWDFFLPSRASNKRAQPSYKIDNSITSSLGLLPLPTTGAGPANLAKRNILRSQQVGLPSGQSVARAMGVTPLRDEQILIGKSTGDAIDTQAITGISSEFAGNAPLWTYILAEATAHAYTVVDGHIVGTQRSPYRLGAVGGRIVTETIIGLLKSDPQSILNVKLPSRQLSLQALFQSLTKPKPGPIINAGQGMRRDRTGFPRDLRN